MKSRAPFLIILAVMALALGSVALVTSEQKREPAPLFRATVNRDCAPWDGPAFTVSIPVEGSTIQISIYHSPASRLPARFAFPDDTMREGYVLLISEARPLEPLTGKVWLERVNQQNPVVGWFRLRSDSGEQFEGKFVAHWGNQAVYCG
jgi:hypothetical protein